MHRHPTEPNRYMLDASIGPIHYGAGQDQEIDTAWQATTGAWDYEMTHADFQVYARDTLNVGDVFRFQKGSQWVDFDPQSLSWVDENYSQQQIAITQAVTASVNDDTLVFTDGFGSGRHFEYQAQTARLQKLVTIDSPGDLPAVSLGGSTIHFQVEFTLDTSSDVEFYLDGVLWAKENGVRVQTADLIEVRDAATGTQVHFYVARPRARDSAGNATVGEMEVRRQGGPSNLYICVRIPKTWIDGATFPIFIDPTIEPQLGDGYGDAHELDSGANFSNSANEVRANANLSATDRWNAGFVWATSGIDQGDTVTAAYGMFYLEQDSRDEAYENVYFEDEDSPNDFDTEQDVTSRSVTSAVAWGDGSPLGHAQWHNTPSLVTPCQAVVDRGGFSVGNNMGVIVKGKSDAAYDLWINSYDNSSTNAAKLHIEYDAGVTPLSIAVTPTNPSYWKQGVRIVG